MTLNQLAHAVLCTLLMLSASRADDSSPYRMDDLQALLAHESWPELLAHLKDVRPAVRDAKWETLVEKAAIGYLEHASDEPSKESFAGSALVQYPSLKKSRPFLDLRSKVALGRYVRCHNDRKARYEWAAHCRKELAEVVKEDGSDALALEAGRAVLRNDGAADSFAFFLPLLREKDNFALCSDADAKRAILGALSLTSGAELSRAMEITDKHCWSQMKEPVLLALGNQSSGPFFDNTCGVLTQRKLLNSLREKLCKKK